VHYFFVWFGQEGQCNVENHLLVFSFKNCQRPERIDWSDSFDRLWWSMATGCWMAEIFKFPRFFCLFTGHWSWWLAENANTFSVCSHLAGENELNLRSTRDFWNSTDRLFLDGFSWNFNGSIARELICNFGFGFGVIEWSVRPLTHKNGRWLTRLSFVTLPVIG
jgi:hypothetical protein